MVTKKDNEYIKNNTTTPPRVSQPVIPIGQLIHDELLRQERTVTWLSRKIHCDRRNIYDIFTRESIDTALLMRISSALNVDFFKVFSEALQPLDTQQSPPPAKGRKTISQR